MVDIRVSKPRVGVQIWAYPIDVLGIIMDQRIIGEVLQTATEEELKRIIDWCHMELDFRNNGPSEKQRRMKMELGKLALALSKAQGAMAGAKKDSSNPFFKSKYADLASVWEACRKPLSDNELSVSQPTCIVDGVTVVKTVLMHSSGEYLEGILPVQVGETATAQQIGSAITYARRYALASMVGVAPEDDDGQSASESPKKSIRAPATLKDQATEFARKIDACTASPELSNLVADNNKLMHDLKQWLPDWFDRMSTKINQNQEAWLLAEDK